MASAHEPFPNCERHACRFCFASRGDHLHAGPSREDCPHCKECPHNPDRPVSVTIELPSTDYATALVENLWFVAKAISTWSATDRNSVTALANQIRAQISNWSNP